MEKRTQPLRQDALEPAGIPFFLFSAVDFIMGMQCMVFIKNLVRSSLDNYVLPGTFTGTEILWLYMAQWKRDLQTATGFSVCILAAYVQALALLSAKAHGAHRKPEEPL